jgi:hypothetical protein
MLFKASYQCVKICDLVKSGQQMFIINYALQKIYSWAEIPKDGAGRQRIASDRN